MRESNGWRMGNSGRMTRKSSGSAAGKPLAFARASERKRLGGEHLLSGPSHAQAVADGYGGDSQFTRPRLGGLRPPVVLH